MKVIPITKKIADEFVTKKHYSRRASIFWAGFGLVENDQIVGVVVYGQPSPAIQKHAFKDRDFRLYELCRLVIQSKTRNAASYLIANSLKMLEQPCAIVSYADTEYNHCGIVYQATNWIYTGATKSHDKLYLIDGVKTHSMTLRDKGITNPTSWARQHKIEMILPKHKHRYFQFVGNKRQKQKMISLLNYTIIKEYPKCDKSRYDDGEELIIRL